MDLDMEDSSQSFEYQKHTFGSDGELTLYAVLLVRIRCLMFNYKTLEIVGEGYFR